MDEQLVRHIARLARIELTDEELRKLAPQLSTIVGYFDRLRELDTTAVTPLVHAVEQADVVAPDEAGVCLGAESVLENAPRHDGVFFRVPRILGGGS